MTLAPPAAGELVVVVGPTASGKTALAIELAERFGGEVIGADSVQVYRRFDIGSGKPTPAERARVPHHLVDVLDPLAPMDAARFVVEADRAIAEVHARGRTPIVCGGTFLWVKALLRGLAPMPPADPAVRARHQALAAAAGRPALHAELTRIDPAAAARLDPNDLVRVSRALEVWELSGRTQTDLHERHAFRAERHRARLVGMTRERADLDRRIAERTAGLLERGFVEEVESLLAAGYGEARAMRSVGYKEVAACVRGELPRAELCDAVVRATRVFARRQRTWLRDEPVEWI
jgi:tRNA dimethylallyltransferase